MQGPKFGLKKKESMKKMLVRGGGVAVGIKL